MIVVMPEQRAPLIYAARAVAIVEIVASLASYAMGLIQALRIHSSRIPLLWAITARSQDATSIT